MGRISTLFPSSARLARRDQCCGTLAKKPGLSRGSLPIPADDTEFGALVYSARISHLVPSLPKQYALDSPKQYALDSMRWKGGKRNGKPQRGCINYTYWLVFASTPQSSRNGMSSQSRLPRQPPSARSRLDHSFERVRVLLALLDVSTQAERWHNR